MGHIYVPVYAHLITSLKKDIYRRLKLPWHKYYVPVFVDIYTTKGVIYYPYNHKDLTTWKWSQYMINSTQNCGHFGWFDSSHSKTLHLIVAGTRKIKLDLNRTRQLKSSCCTLQVYVLEDVPEIGFIYIYHSAAAFSC